jgi:hypothetical protein
MRLLLGRPARLLGALLAVVVALCCATAGVASAEEPTVPAGSINLGADEPTATIPVDGGAIELIPATSYELPPESAAGSTEDSAISVQGVSSEIADVPSSEAQGASSSTGPTSSAGVGGPISVTWFAVGLLVILAAAAVWLARSRRAARH